MHKKNTYYIKENSFIAWLAAKKLRSAQVAIVIGKTIHLHNTSQQDFLADSCWLRHELCHIQQFKRYGFFTFIYLYIIESIKVGYNNNKFEIEARKAELDIHPITYELR